ncbi:MAG: VIT domain-containing protein [Enhygromyxa sp.]
MPAPRLPSSRGVLRTFALALPLLGCQAQPPADQAEGEVNSGAQGASLEVATITKIRGSRGVSSADLPAGAFLGEGAALRAGQPIELPRGTRVELSLGAADRPIGRLRIDEDSRLTLPERIDGEQPTQIELGRGRLIVLAEDGQPIEVLAGEDRLLVERGEVELHHAGATRHFGVVSGRAVLHTAGREVPLGPGASISTPAAPEVRPETPPDPNILAAALIPSTSLAPLHESAWAAAFDESARLAEDLPEGVGSLVARRAGSSLERQSLRLTEQTVKVTISGRIARTEIEQAFHNDSSQTLEGIYQFPLPSDASISDLQLLVGDTWMRGEMLEKTRARQIFRQIVDATVPRDPALLQWERGSVFRLNIFPIPGKGERRIKIAYTQVLPSVGEELRYRYPMGGSGARATEIGDFRFEVTVDDQELDAEARAQISTPMAELRREDQPGAGLRLSMREQDYQPTHELGVDIPLPKEQRRVMAATHRDRDGQGYFMLSLRPEFELEQDRRPVHYAFVLDRSHGTTPELWAAAEGMTKAMLATLEPDDRFTVLACDSACDRLDGGLRGAGGADTLAQLDRFLDAQALAGASDIGNMLVRAAASLEAGEAGEAERVIVYMGDGAPTSGALTPDELGALAREQLATVRVQAVALGARSDLLVLDNLVRQSGGDMIQVDARDRLENIARELRLRASVPLARDLALELPPGLTDVYPKALPALRPGDTLTLVGKLAEGDPKALRGDLRLHGRTRAGAVDERFQVMLDAEYSGAGSTGVHAHLPRTWAQQEIAHLTQTEGAAASERIVALSREYNVLSRFTALLVLENDRMYREFNVARKAADKDAWTGSLESEDPDEAKPEREAPAAAPPTTTGTTTLPGGLPSEDAERSEQARPDPVPATEPSEPVRDRDRDHEDRFDSLELDEAPADRRKSESFADFDGFEEEPEGGSSSGFDGASGKGSGQFAPAPPPKKPSSSSKSSKKKIAGGDFIGGGESIAWDGPPRWRGGGGGRRHWQPKLQVRSASGPSSADRKAIGALQVTRDANPSDRKAHRELVRRAIRSGHPETLAFTAAWATSDPDHAPALLAHADSLAAAGDPLALRAYASAIEVEPFSVTMHRRMAVALRSAGDFERACSHRRALVSIDPRDGKAAADLVECLLESGRVDQARAALTRAQESVSSSAGKQALAKADKLLAKGVVSRSAFVHSRPELRAELRWTADENLDLAFVDSRGRRLSVLRPQGVLVREERDGTGRLELMTLRKVSGTVFIEVTRPESKREDPLPATLVIKTPSGQRRFELLLDPGGKRVASVRWQR